MSYIPVSLRNLVYRRAAGHCEFCKASVEIIIAYAVDHIRPESKGGETSAENLCLICHLCNGSKLDFMTGVDPVIGAEVALFHPREQQWRDHFKWNEDFTQIVGLTSTGRATINRLKLNRPSFIRARTRWLTGDWLPPTD